MRSSLGIAVSVLTVSALAGAAPAEIASGVVYHDKNGNGVRDEGERGIAGVKVSNAADVVVTDERGRYEIEIDDDDDIVFVVKPRGYRTAIDELNIPRFYYIHKPGGSPDEGFVYEGVAPTGDLPGSIDFPLYPQDEPEQFKVLFIGDPQPYSVEEVEWYARDTLAELEGTDAAFAVSLGDLVGDRLELFAPLNEAQGTVGVPWYNVYGNHDMNFRSPDDEHADETFERVYGPPNYAFQYAGVHFVVLDDVIWQGYEGDRDDGRPKNGNYRGGLRDDQLGFVENYLSHVPAEELVVLMFHIPIEGEDVHRIPEQRRLFEILSGHTSTLSLSGHTHFQRHWFFGQSHGYTAGGEHHHLNGATASGSWYRGATDVRGIPHSTMRCGAPNGYNVVTFDGADYNAQFKASSEPADSQMRIWVPGGVSSAESGGAEILVNVFGASERSRVWLRVNDGAWAPMQQSIRPDPFLEAIKARERGDSPPDGRPIPSLDDSHHLWIGSLPEALEPGFHRISVRTVDMFGNEYQDSTLLHVLE